MRRRHPLTRTDSKGRLAIDYALDLATQFKDEAQATIESNDQAWNSELEEMRDSQREMMLSAEESHAQELEALKAEHAEEVAALTAEIAALKARLGQGEGEEEGVPPEDAES